MNIDSIKNGIVLDHIKAGMGMKVYKDLGLETLECSVAIIQNATSGKIGKKDIIKISDDFHVNLDVLGYIDPDITVNIIKEGKIVKKMTLSLPEKIVNIEKCHNPRCITSVEQELDQIFYLSDREKKVYRCIYCESKIKEKGW